MKPRFDKVLDHCLETGVKFGINRAFKHDDNPSREVIEENVTREIMNQFYEWFEFTEVDYER